MIRHTLKKHTYKIAFGVPMVVLVASSLMLVRDKEEMCLIPEDNRYVEIGETVTLHVTTQSDTPINVIGADITYPQDLIMVETVSKEDSIIDLWSKEPVIGEDGNISFSGGIVREGGFTGDGRVITFIVKPLKEGTAEFTFTESTMLAHDGTGMEVECGSTPITLFIRPARNPSPDVNGDREVNLFDFGIVSARLFMGYERSYDLNLDGKITMADIGVLLLNMKKQSGLGSLAVSLFTQ